MTQDRKNTVLIHRFLISLSSSTFLLTLSDPQPPLTPSPESILGYLVGRERFQQRTSERRLPEWITSPRSSPPDLCCSHRDNINRTPARRTRVKGRLSALGQRVPGQGVGCEIGLWYDAKEE
ncbi:unnamed protein product [Nezara viridula]|uniref:Neuropeptide n=1 Tax=Nezara viridula TaxID=85310 RepID=A0A9P0E276_NEZVI|nr:unnamed protein product [Nezara viridula]